MRRTGRMRHAFRTSTRTMGYFVAFALLGLGLLGLMLPVFPGLALLGLGLAALLWTLLG